MEVLHFMFGIFGWECNRPLPVLVTHLNVSEDYKEKIHGGILGGAIQHDTAQLPPLSLVRPPVRVAEQPPGVDDQRHRRGDRDGVRPDLPRLRSAEGAGPDARPPRPRHLVVRRRRVRLRLRPPRLGSEGLLWIRRRHLLHLHVRLAFIDHEIGDPNEERGVHALLLVAVRVPLRNLVVHLRPPRPRPFHRGAQRLWEHVGGYAADPVRDLQESQGPDRRRRLRRGDGRR